MTTDPRGARAYAEAWYQAVRRWETDTYEVPVPSGSGARRAVLLTSGTPGMIVCSYLRTPLGRTVTATEAARIISAWEVSVIPAQREAGVLLGRLRAERGPETLLRDSGAFIHPVERARAYAVAALHLGVTLGDGVAAVALSCVKSEIRVSFI